MSYYIKSSLIFIVKKELESLKISSKSVGNFQEKPTGRWTKEFAANFLSSYSESGIVPFLVKNDCCIYIKQLRKWTPNYIKLGLIGNEDYVGSWDYRKSIKGLNHPANSDNWYLPLLIPLNGNKSIIKLIAMDERNDSIHYLEMEDIREISHVRLKAGEIILEKTTLPLKKNENNLIVKIKPYDELNDKFSIRNEKLTYSINHKSLTTQCLQSKEFENCNNSYVDSIDKTYPYKMLNEQIGHGSERFKKRSKWNKMISSISLNTNDNGSCNRSFEDSISFNCNSNNNNNSKKKKKKKAKAKDKKAKIVVHIDDSAVKQDMDADKGTASENNLKNREENIFMGDSITESNDILVYTAMTDEGAAGDISSLLTKKMKEEEEEEENLNSSIIKEETDSKSLPKIPYEELLENIIRSLNLPLWIAKQLAKWRYKIKSDKKLDIRQVSSSYKNFPAVPKPSADEIYTHLNVSRTISDDLTSITHILSQIQSLPNPTNDNESDFTKYPGEIDKNEKEDINNSVSESSFSNENVNWKPSQHCHSNMSDLNDNPSPLSQNQVIEEREKNIQLQHKRTDSPCHSGEDTGVRITDQDIYFTRDSEISFSLNSKESEKDLMIPKIRVVDEHDKVINIPEEYIQFPSTLTYDDKCKRTKLQFDKRQNTLTKQFKSTGTETVNLKADVEHLLVNLIDNELDKRKKTRQETPADDVILKHNTDKIGNEFPSDNQSSENNLDYRTTTNRIKPNKLPIVLLKKVESTNEIRLENNEENKTKHGSLKKSKTIREYLTLCKCTCATAKRA
ncbi:DgyrCDS4472 [Dimorphilus gyrociliatus]|uniref:DgyrCDS4472 n=1 Tax=Dimorphilus gyrociliatus TaxID=2664684 RepID=A0A7I8VHM2_9ANNE|nr:DgyrCDS4472 [Dimorphilus gyrociliatus]